MKSIDKEFYRLVGLYLRNIRESKGYSIQYVSDKVSVILKKSFLKQSLSKMELGKLRIDNDIYNAICFVLEIDPKSIYKNCSPNIQKETNRN